MKPEIVRFWIWINDGYVRLAIKDGQILSHRKAWAHEEGWSSEETVWSREGNTITRSHYTGGRDCDGRMTTFEESETDVDHLTIVSPYDDEDRPLMPEWKPVESGQRDFTAESMGY